MAKRDRNRRTATVRPRKKTLIVVIWAILMLIGLLVIIMRDIGPAIELWGAGMIAVWLILEVIRLMGSELTVEIDPDTVAIRRGGTVLYEGPYFAAKRTFVPLKGVAFAIEPLPVVRSMVMNFTNVFVLNVRRNRIALPGAFLEGLDEVWEAIPAERRAN